MNSIDLPKESSYPELAPVLIAEERSKLLKSLQEAQLPSAQSSSKIRDATDKRSSRLAELRYSARLAALNSFEARLAADRAAFGDISGSVKQPDVLARDAASAERLARYLAAEEEQLKAEIERDRAKTNSDRDPKNQAVQKALDTAEQTLAKARVAMAETKKGLDDHSSKYTRIGEIYPRRSSGRRLALARWIASRDNPLTARVVVNHIWMRHFGSPLVSTIANFGNSGKPPSHPELLDWLAVEFMERGWSMRELHRLLVTSGTYRMQSDPKGPNDPNLKIDRDNVALWRMNSRRMEAEVVRDSLLRLAGHLDHSLGGKDLDPPLADSVPRRSVFFRHTPDDRPDLLVSFDAANPLECFRREESILPQQALAMANGSLTRAMAKLVAKELEGSASNGQGISDDQKADEFVIAAFGQILNRPPSELERARSRKFLKDQTALLSKLNHSSESSIDGQGTRPGLSNAEMRAREDFIHVLFNHNDFVTVR